MFLVFLDLQKIKHTNSNAKFAFIKTPKKTQKLYMHDTYFFRYNNKIRDTH